MNKMKYHFVGTFPKSTRKIVERSRMDTPNTDIQDRSLSWHGTGNSMKSDNRVNFVLWAQTLTHKLA